MLALASKLQNVFIDTSSYKVKRYTPSIIHYLKTNGKNKVMFGLNYPMIKPKDFSKAMKKLYLPEEVFNSFLKTAERVFESFLVLNFFNNLGGGVIVYKV